MPSKLLVPCPELDHAALCQTFLALGLSEDTCTVAGISAGFQCTFSASPLLLLSASTQGGYTDPLDNLLASDQEDPAGPCRVPWALDVELPSTRLPPLLSFPLDGSTSLTEGSRPGEAKGLSSRYKTELCRTFEESGTCKYGAKCQFAHGVGELRGLSRHPKYKTEPCRTFHTSGICPYGARCHFIHNAEEGRLLRRKDPLFRPRLGSGGGIAGESLPSAPANLLLPLPFFPGVGLNPNPAPGPVCSLSTTGSGPLAFPSHLWVLQKSLSADSLSDHEDSGSSVGSIGSESPGLGPPASRRLPIFSQISVSDDWRGYLGEEGGADDDWAGSRGNPTALTPA